MGAQLVWWLRKAVRRGAAAATQASGWPALRRLWNGQPLIRAVTYHRFSRAPRDPWVVLPEDFGAHLRWLAESRRAVSLDDVLGFVAGSRAVPDGAVLVTIDDGCLSTLTEAVPLLRQHAIPAVAFVSAGLVGSAGGARDHEERYLDWEELRELARAGVEIGSHSYEHRSLARLPRDEAAAQVRRSRAELESQLGVRVRAFAYPFGMRADFSPVTDAAIEQAGYEIAFNSMHGAIAAGMRPFSLPRVKVEGGEGLTMFRRTCAGGMDSWRLVDSALGHVRTRRAETAAGH